MASREDQSLFRKALTKIKEDGTLSLAKSGPPYVYSNYLRNHLLTYSEIVSYNGIEAPYKMSIFDQIVPGYNHPSDDPTYENPEVDAVRTHSKNGDKVVIVGAGRGITPTAAANSVGKDGLVVAYEASADRISCAQKTVQYNQVSDIVELHHTIVAKAESVSGQVGSPTVLPPDELPDCDFLELDCEGAEEKILEEMTISPRVISVETHETKRVSHANVMEMLENKGYHIGGGTDKTDMVEGIRHIVALLDE
jgi:hypothetical protein